MKKSQYHSHCTPNPKQSQTNKPSLSRKSSFRNNTKSLDRPKRLLNNHSIINNFSDASSDIPDAARLAPVKKKDSELPVIKDKNSNVVPVASVAPQTEKLEQNKKEADIVEVKEDILKNEVKSEVSLPQKRAINLDEFETRQKLIEEQNRKRKELLAKALADRTRQTQEEAQRLNEIQTEFKKLDALLSNDVRILRKQIESASLEYLDAEKKYLKIEKDYLEAKLYLHQKLERKQMLTEHLCAIIERNEERKAEKLTELLQKLHMTDYSDGCDTPGSSSMISGFLSNQKLPPLLVLANCFQNFAIREL